MTSAPSGEEQGFVVWLGRAIATAGGAGYSPVAPGTMGTIVAVPIAWLTSSWPLSWFALFVTAVTLVGVWAAYVADHSWGTHDSGRIVIDEVAGYLVTLLWVDRTSYAMLGLGFLLFRILDIFKPFPVGRIDKHVPGGWGVVLDDILAGVYASGLLYLAWKNPWLAL